MSELGLQLKSKNQARLMPWILLLFSITLCSCSYYLDYKEQSMKENFEEHFDIFNLLQYMQKEDEHYYVIADTWKQKYLTQGPDLKMNIQK